MPKGADVVVQHDHPSGVVAGTRQWRAAFAVYYGRATRPTSAPWLNAQGSAPRCSPTSHHPSERPHKGRSRF
ncbi:MAG: hypothetical protein MZV49_20060 [Rhodopseudomonas palustris]|nr:hypothetical protein [Rhodopseudomonas palustris]